MRSRSSSRLSKDQSLIFGAPESGAPAGVAPINVTVANNWIFAARTSVVAGLGLTTPTVAGNLTFGVPLGFSPTTGFTEIDPMLTRATDGLFRPAPTSPAFGAASGTFAVTTDIDGQARTGACDVGCDQVNGAGATRGPLKRTDVGPQMWSISVP